MSNFFRLESSNSRKYYKEDLKELKLSDLKDNPELIKIFNIFDTQKADGSSGSDGVLNKDELNSLFDIISQTAGLKNEKDVLDNDDVEEYLKNTKNSDGKSLKELGIAASDMFKFLKSLFENEDNKQDVLYLSEEDLNSSDESYKYLSPIKKQFVEAGLQSGLINRDNLSSCISNIFQKNDDSFNENTLKMLKKALEDKNLNITYKDALELSDMDEAQYNMTSQIYLNQKRDDNPLTISDIAKILKKFPDADTVLIEKLISTKVGASGTYLDDYTITELLKISEEDRNSFFELINKKMYLQNFIIDVQYLHRFINTCRKISLKNTQILFFAVQQTEKSAILIV